MKRATLAMAWIAALFLARPDHVAAREPGRPWRIGFLSTRAKPADPSRDYHDGLARGLRELGYVEGKHLTIDWRFADGKTERYPELLKELLSIPVDILVTDGTPSTLAAQKATKSIPIVFGGAGDPVGNGLVASLARPGGNTTGVALLSNSSSSKQLEMLRAMVPRLSRVAVILNPENPYSGIGLEAVKKAARELKLEVLPVEVRDRKDLEQVFETMQRQKANAFIYLPDSVLAGFRASIAELEGRHRIPGMAAGALFPEAGGLLSYGQNLWENFRRAAVYVHKIMNGANPGELPVEQPMKLELVINRRKAKALGLEIPAELAVLADRIID